MSLVSIYLPLIRPEIGARCPGDDGVSLEGVYETDSRIKTHTHADTLQHNTNAGNLGGSLPFAFLLTLWQ